MEGFGVILLSSIGIKLFTRFNIMDTNDTIAAICTGTGGAIAVIRISGAAAAAIGNRIWHGRRLLDRQNARLMLLGNARFTDRGSDSALAVYMPGPGSYTGEDTVEIQCHGGNLAAGKILTAALQAGARMAEPGEFTYRAFINGKMDLTQAEAVADIINAGSHMALHLAERQNSGVLGRRLDAIRQKLIDILAEIESRMDFTEEDLDWTPAEQTAAVLLQLQHELAQLLSSREDGAVLRDGIRAVIAGRPNAGKSSLLNWLLGFDRAIVTAIPGTTRDTLEETAHLRGIPVHLIDTAGLRQADNQIECLGIDRSRKSLAQAQIVFWVLDAAADPETEVAAMHRQRPERTPVVAIWNKLDLVPSPLLLPETGLPTVKISVAKENGLDDLLDEFEKAVWHYPHTAEPELAVSARHAALLEAALQALPEAIVTITDADWELAAVNLRETIAAIGQITGQTVSPDILDNIFSRFCIGK